MPPGIHPAKQFRTILEGERARSDRNGHQFSVVLFEVGIMLYVLNEVPTSVNCQGKTHVRPGIEDVTNMTLSFANGNFASIQSSWLDPNKVRDMTFVGTEMNACL